MGKLLDLCAAPGATIVDPYMGSGPIAKACKDRGIRYVGIELVEKYCELTVNRLRQEVLFGSEAQG
jgi:DNA modification methylase